MESVVRTPAASKSLPDWIAWSLLWIGVVAASIAAILIRYADDAGPLALSFWRCAGGALTLLPFLRPRSRGLGRGNTLASMLAGLFLALHFAAWITSVGLTTIAASVLLVSTTPVFTALASWMFFRERLRSLGWLGIGLTLAGVALISGGGFGGSSATGNLLALIGGAAVAAYLIVGERARQELGIVEYAVIAYATGGLLLAPVCLAVGQPLWGYDAETWWAIAGLILGPQLLGHTVINFVLSDLDSTTVAVAIMVEPIIATVLAYFLFSETPSSLVYPGGLLILSGIYLVARVRREPVLLME
jgi:drug/metabolite transporter (DMT)-like permease